MRLLHEKCGLLAALLAALLVQPVPAPAADVLKIGSKRFTESYILGELLVQAAARHGPAEHKPGLGNTGILYAALRSGSIDVYPEYSGTIAREILKLEGNPGPTELNRSLAPVGLAVSIALGFNNTYALGVREELAARLGVNSITDLAAHPDLRLGLSQEFIARKDGWPGLARAYGLASFSPTGLDHGLAYEALAGGRVDVIDTYSTDAKIARYRIRLLADDRGYFPRYDTLLLHREDTPRRFPLQWQALSALEGKIDERSMIRMNAAAETEGRSFTQAATLFFQEPARGTSGAQPRGFFEVMLAPDLGRLTREHLLLVFGSLAASIAVGVPLGVAAARKRWIAQPIFALVGVIQTIPSLALLAFLIALMGTIGTLPAAIALFLYALLPIVRNTHTGLLAVGDGLRQAALALGLSPRDRLLSIELPLARPSILAGIKTSAVINVGTATIAAFIGAGGYGERIAAGLAVNDNLMLLAGAVPAAALALLIQGLFDFVERRADPLRKK
ncbi:MAG: amino acid ABC transporter permease [Betaproteobacteria bacterium RIFCSPLOWO2_12_FULL_65_14]|nr:MAG: amino acid ABC transporter permease [Betaproteobacteria bacterium RIFCSPLOWO2_12_FULL_65_14]